MEEPRDRLHEKQKPEEDMAEAFGSGRTTLSCIDPNNNNNKNNNNNNRYRD